MAFQRIDNVMIEGISSTVPKTVLTNENIDILGDRVEQERFRKATGISERRVVGNSELCASDLCYDAAKKLIDNLKWDINEIDCLIFVTQTPDYMVPSTSSILQSRLGLSKECFALQVSLGCSGWVYGLATTAQLLSSGYLSKGLLLVGDTVTKTKSPLDKATYPLFGDAGTATALVHSLDAKPLYFDSGTDGEGYDSIIIRDGGFRNFFSKSSLTSKEYPDGSIRNNLQSYLNGSKVFTFGIKCAPKSILSLIEKANLNKDEIDYFVLHQANLMMNKIIGKKIKVPSNKMPTSLSHFGNTSGASIPLTLVTKLNNHELPINSQIIACGFGVGLSWGSVYFNLNNTKSMLFNEL